VIGRHTVFEGMRSARVFCDIAADRAGRLRGRIGRIIVAVILDGIANMEIDDPTFDFDPAVGEINREDMVHARRANHHRCVERQASARKPGTRATRHERNPALME
jgi:hypothetical protein